VVDQRVAHAFDVHHAARGEVANALAQLADIGVHAAVISLRLRREHVASADGTALGHVKWRWRAACLHTFTLGYIALPKTSDAHAQRFNPSCVQRGRLIVPPSKTGAACHGRQLPSADLYQDIFDLLTGA